ncbi:MAG: type II toxin-antitoxin system HipA family toxin [bacterium]
MGHGGVRSVEHADVMLWGRVIGHVAWDRERDIAAFEYEPDFQRSGIEPAPLMMPLGPRIYSFPELAARSFHGLPGMLADSLPDRFGNLLIDQWLVRSGRDAGSFSPIERLCYVGTRGMGALEFQPAMRKRGNESVPLDIAELVELAKKALSEKASLSTRLARESRADLDAMRHILQVGTSAGGARAKAIIAWNEATGEIRSGQVRAPAGFGYWLLKFDGVAGNRDKELLDPQGYGKIEYAYHRMALAAGVRMAECRIYEENGRHHFITRRFDRDWNGGRIFTQTLCALGHMDFNQAGAYSYEQALLVAQQLGLPADAVRQLFRRMVFNVLARNQDDHTKNIAFLMDKQGHWSLAPAYDVIYSYNPSGEWTGCHQMTVNGKRDGFAKQDLLEVARRFRIKKPDAIIAEVGAAVRKWPDFAETAYVDSEAIVLIQSTLRLDLA